MGDDSQSSGDKTFNLTGGFTEEAGGLLPPARYLKPGTLLSDNYEIQSVIGEGGMGIVYRAIDTTLSRPVAIKTLHSNLMGDRGIRRRFVREARLMTRWSHANVATVYDLIDTDPVLAMVMELIEGQSLERALVAWKGQIPLAELEGVFFGVLDAMADAHQIGIIHRDLKPGNILLRSDADGWTPKVIDFGIAKVLEGTTYTMTGALIGTCRYMSPEQAQKPEHLDHRTDIYSLGVTLYEALCGRGPFEHENNFSLMMAHVTEPPPPPSRFRPELPEGLEALLLDCLAKEPSSRPQSCGIFKARLAESLSGIEARRSPVRPRPRTIHHAHGGSLNLIPGGSFQMGPSRRSVWLDDFYIDRYPVTNRQFARFLKATGYRPSDDEAHRFLSHWTGGLFPERLADHPVVCVSWSDARAYCSWAGLRLPTEAEWEKAARGTDGRRYPWGRPNPGPEHAHFNTHPSHGTAPVSAHPEGASPYGIEDLAGNVWEWCDDVDDPAFYQDGPVRNPRNPAGAERGSTVVRGGAWMFDAPTLKTWSRRSFQPDYRLEMVGFRAAL